MFRLILLAALTLVNAACSRTELAYRNADWLLDYYAWKTVRTDAAQREQWDPILQDTLHRHRERELPLVIAYLELADRIVRKQPDSPGATCLVDGALLLYQRHARLAAELAAPLLADLDSAQITHLAEYGAEVHQDAVKRYLDPDPQRRERSRQRRITQRIERWTGTLNNDQRQRIQDAVEGIPDLGPSWLTYRARQTDALITMLKTGTDTQALRVFLNDWWVHREGTPVETRRLWHVARHQFIELMEDLATMLTDRQRAALTERLADLRGDLSSFVTGSARSVRLQQLPTCDSESA